MDRKILTAEEGLEVLTDRGGGAHGQTNPADKGGAHGQTNPTDRGGHTSRKEGFGPPRVSPLVPVQSRTGTNGGISPGSCGPPPPASGLFVFNKLN